MANVPLRISPSGPVIGTLGDGFVLRSQSIVKVITSGALLGGANEVASDVGGDSQDMRPELSNTVPASKCVARLECDLDGIGGAYTTGDVSVRLQLSRDNGATWTDIAGSNNGATVDTNQLHHISLESEPFTVGDLADYAAGDTVLARATIAASAPGLLGIQSRGPTGNATVTLSEVL